MLRPFLAVLLIPGCTPGDDDVVDTSACEDGDPSLLVGTGFSAFEPTEPGATLSLIHGPQGGYHLDIGLAATGLPSTDRVAVHLVGTIDGEVLADQTPYVTFRCDSSEARYEAWGQRLIFDAEPLDLHRQTAVITATLSLPDRDLTATTQVVIDDPDLP